MSRRNVSPLRPGTMKRTREKWRGSKYDSYLIAHEHLCVFRKPVEGEDLKDYKYSRNL